MGESLPAAAPPSEAATAPTEAATEPAADDQSQRELRRRFHVPVSVFVTLLVAGLSVWVAPALTRQWEDREKARDLQAQTAEMISAASAEALGEISAAAETPGSVTDLEDVRRQWLVDRHRIQARLDAYFSAQVSEQWNAHGDVVERAFDVVRTADRAPTEACRQQAQVRENRCNVKLAVDFLAGSIEWAAMVRTRRVGGRAFYAYQPQDVDTPDGARGFILGPISPVLLASVGWVTEAILNEDPRGFSTTRRDFFDDLLP